MRIKVWYKHRFDTNMCSLTCVVDGEHHFEKVVERIQRPAMGVEFIISFDIGHVYFSNLALLRSLVDLLSGPAVEPFIHPLGHRLNITCYNSTVIDHDTFMWLAGMPSRINIRIFTGNKSYFQSRITTRIREQMVLFTGTVEEKIGALTFQKE